jgi:hypothetical protein
MFVNAISQSLTPVQKAAAATAVSDLKLIFTWFLNLNPDDRKSIVKMGDKSEAFVRKVLQVLKANPSVAGTLDLTEFEKDLVLFDDLREFAALLTPFYEGLNDTMLLLGSELIQQANTGYANIKEAAKTNSALTAAADELGARYAKSSRGVVNVFSFGPNETRTLNGIVPDRQFKALVGGPFAVYKGPNAVGKNILVAPGQPFQIPFGWTTITVVNMSAAIGVFQCPQE